MKKFVFKFATFLALVSLAACEKETVLDASVAQVEKSETSDSQSAELMARSGANVGFRVRFFDGSNYTTQLIDRYTSISTEYSKERTVFLPTLSIQVDNKISSFIVSEIKVGTKGDLSVVIYDNANYLGSVAEYTCKDGCPGGILKKSVAAWPFLDRNNKGSSIRVVARYIN
jgi:hypothetical protein